MKNTKKLIYSGLALLVLGLGLITFYSGWFQKTFAALTFDYPEDCASSTLGTSTRVTLVPGAASTTLMSCPTKELDIFGTQFTLEASSTATVFWNIETSQNGIDWAVNDGAAYAGSIVLGNSATTSRQVLVDPFVGKHVRVRARVPNSQTGTTSIHSLGLRVQKVK